MSLILLPPVEADDRVEQIREGIWRTAYLARRRVENIREFLKRVYRTPPDQPFGSDRVRCTSKGVRYASSEVRS